MVANLHPAGGVRVDVAGLAVHEHVGPLLKPRVIGRDVVGHVVQDQPCPACRQRGAGRGQSVGPAECGVHDVAAYAVRRTEQVLRLHVGQRVAERVHQLQVRSGQGQPGGTAFPDPHQPDGVDTVRRGGGPVAVGDVGEGDVSS